MNARRIVVPLAVLTLVVGGRGSLGAAPPPAPATAEAAPTTPSRLSDINGEVSFWRPGIQQWVPARVNIPLAPGDVLHASENGTVEIQVGPRAFVRAAGSTEVGLDTEGPDFVQFRVTAGHAALDLRELDGGAPWRSTHRAQCSPSSTRAPTAWTWRRIPSHSRPVAAQARR